MPVQTPVLWCQTSKVCLDLVAGVAKVVVSHRVAELRAVAVLGIVTGEQQHKQQWWQYMRSGNLDHTCGGCNDNCKVRVRVMLIVTAIVMVLAMAPVSVSINGTCIGNGSSTGRTKTRSDIKNMTSVAVTVALTVTAVVAVDS